MLHIHILQTIAGAHYDQGHYAKAATVYETCANLLETKEQFRDAAAMMCLVGTSFHCLEDMDGAVKWFQKARKLGEENGFYSAECGACLGLGRVALKQGRTQEAEELFRVSLSTLDFVEDNVPSFPLTVLARSVNLAFARLLLTTERFEDAGPSVQRLRELSEEEPDPKNAIHFDARLLAVEFHLKRGDRGEADKEVEVPPPCTP